MSETEQQLALWMEELQQYHLPRWEELPDIELYMDQVITLIERYLSPLVGQTDSKVITSAMINNYVKLNIMPKPNKKQLRAHSHGLPDRHHHSQANPSDPAGKGRDFSAVKN